MSACDVGRIEAWLDDALPPSEGAELSAHLQACLGCARELLAQRRERSRFAQRALSSPPPVPAFGAVLAAVQRPRPHRARRTAPAWIAAGMAAALVLLGLAATLHQASGSGDRCRDRAGRDIQLAAATLPAGGSGGACYLSDGENAPSVELAEATEDARCAACLVASPVPGDRCL